MDLINANLKIEKSPIHGWGIFTNEFIKKNTIVIQNPGILFQVGVPYKENLLRYFYPCGDNFLLGLGYASLINSSDNPNTTFKVDSENEIITIISICDIEPNQEITFKYL